MKIDFTILGEAASKSNSRKAALTSEGKPTFIKSEKAIAYAKSAGFQIPTYAQQRLECTVKVTGIVYYDTWQPDLDESLLLDVLQDRWLWVGAKGSPNRRKYLERPGVYCNDRQVIHKHFVRGVLNKADPNDVPRAEIRVEPCEWVRMTMPDFPTLDQQREREIEFRRTRGADKPQQGSL